MILSQSLLLETGHRYFQNISDTGTKQQGTGQPLFEKSPINPVFDLTNIPKAPLIIREITFSYTDEMCL